MKIVVVVLLLFSRLSMLLLRVECRGVFFFFSFLFPLSYLYFLFLRSDQVPVYLTLFHNFAFLFPNLFLVSSSSAGARGVGAAERPVGLPRRRLLPRSACPALGQFRLPGQVSCLREALLCLLSIKAFSLFFRI